MGNRNSIRGVQTEPEEATCTQHAHSLSAGASFQVAMVHKKNAKEMQKDCSW